MNSGDSLTPSVISKDAFVSKEEDKRVEEENSDSVEERKPSEPPIPMWDEEGLEPERHAFEEYPGVFDLRHSNEITSDEERKS